MKMYWPMAEYKQMEQSALPTRLFTYTASDTMKEAREESGLKNIELISSDIFDLGVHLIPKYKNIPQHYHYDIRFLLRASNLNENIIMSNESTDLDWFSDIPKNNPAEANRDIFRMMVKWKNRKNR